MIKRNSRYGNAQVIHAGKIWLGQNTGLMYLGKEDFQVWTFGGSPVADVMLQGPQLTILVLARMYSLQSIKDAFSFQAVVVFQQIFDPGPVFLEGIFSGSPVVDRLDLAGKPAPSAVLASSPIAHARLGRGCLEPLFLIDQLHQ